jgi:hypothetical protein
VHTQSPTRTCTRARTTQVQHSEKLEPRVVNVSNAIPMPSWVERQCLFSRKCEAYGGCRSNGECRDIVCPKGTFSISSTRTCEKCKPGYSKQTEGVGVCEPCAPGFFQSDEGQEMCVKCSVFGQAYQDRPNATACLLCPALTQRVLGSQGTAITDCQCECLPACVFLAAGFAQHRGSCNRCALEHWRHDGLAGLNCSRCPTGAICEVCFQPCSSVSMHVLSNTYVVVLCQGGNKLPYPLPGYWALSRTSGNVTSLMAFEKPGSSDHNRYRDPAALDETPFFLPCGSASDGGSVCQGDQSFSCTPGYMGILCQQCEKDRFLTSLSSCDVQCKDIEPRGLVTILGIFCVILCWLVMNKMTAGQ